MWLSFWMTFSIWLFYSALAKNPGDYVSINGNMLLACCVCLPFIFFDFTEKWYMFIVLVFVGIGFATKSLLVGAAYPLVSDRFYKEVVNSWEETRNLAVTLAVGLSLCFGYLQSVNTQSQKNISELALKIEAQKKLLSEKENALARQQNEIKAIEEENRKALAEIERQNRELSEARKELERIGLELITRREEMERTRRLEDTLNEFSAVIRDNILKTPAEFYDKNLRKLVEFLDAAQAVMFVAIEDAEGVKLKAVAAYAYHTDLRMIKPVLPGDGLIGQAYKSARTFYFERMPVNSFEIKSALAALQPFATIVLPLIDNAMVRGVVQFALSRPLEDWERAFLDRHSVQLAAAIVGMQARILQKAA
ncbi:MAG: GAF domain-containing protein [Bacteroidia bacterium]|nr:GAF domain-containing protein [Bacteroidia bacterium]